MQHRTTATDLCTGQSSIYLWLAAAFFAVGVGASVVTADFFIVGLCNMETDPAARNALVAAGVLMIIAEVLSFGAAGLLPRQMRMLRRNLIVFGVTLLLFEVVTIYVTQIALVQVSAVEAQSTQTRIATLENSIANQRASTAALRKNAEQQMTSKNSWVRVQGTKSIQTIADLEAQTTKQGMELAELQKMQRPTMISILGKEGTVGYSVARSLLISTVGIMMSMVAGSLIRAYRDATIFQHATDNNAIEQKSDIVEASSTGKNSSLFGKGALYTQIAPIVTFGVSILTVPAQAQAQSVQFKEVVAADSSSLDAVNDRQHHAQQQPKDTGTRHDTGIGHENGSRFSRVRDAIRSRQIAPSIRAIWKFAGASQRVAQRYLEAMEMAGEIERGKKGYRLVNCERASTALTC